MSQALSSSFCMDYLTHQPLKLWGALIMSVVWMGEPRQTEVKQLVQGHPLLREQGAGLPTQMVWV